MSFQSKRRKYVCVPETFKAPPHQIAAVECQQMVVRADSIVFMAIPKHASFYVQTVEIPLAMLEAATDQRFDHTRLTHQELLPISYRT